VTRRQAAALLLAAALLGGGRCVRQRLLVDGTGAWRDPLLLDRCLPADETPLLPVGAGVPAVNAGGAGGGPVPTHAAPSAVFTGLINVNTAPADSLELLPGIGPALAKRLVADRAARGPYLAAGDLERVNGIGPRIAARLAPRLRFATPPPARPSPPPAASAPGAL
jgi:competence protein ComEA